MENFNISTEEEYMLGMESMEEHSNSIPNRSSNNFSNDPRNQSLSGEFCYHVWILSNSILLSLFIVEYNVIAYRLYPLRYILSYYTIILLSYYPILSYYIISYML